MFSENFDLCIDSVVVQVLSVAPYTRPIVGAVEGSSRRHRRETPIALVQIYARYGGPSNRVLIPAASIVEASSVATQADRLNAEAEAEAEDADGDGDGDDIGGLGTTAAPNPNDGGPGTTPANGAGGGGGDGSDAEEAGSNNASFKGAMIAVGVVLAVLLIVALVMARVVQRRKYGVNNSLKRNPITIHSTSPDDWGDVATALQLNQSPLGDNASQLDEWGVTAMALRNGQPLPPISADEQAHRTAQLLADHPQRAGWSPPLTDMPAAAEEDWGSMPGVGGDTTSYFDVKSQVTRSNERFGALSPTAESYLDVSAKRAMSPLVAGKPEQPPRSVTAWGQRSATPTAYLENPSARSPTPLLPPAASVDARAAQSALQLDSLQAMRDLCEKQLAQTQLGTRDSVALQLAQKNIAAQMDYLQIGSTLHVHSVAAPPVDQANPAALIQRQQQIQEQRRRLQVKEQQQQQQQQREQMEQMRQHAVAAHKRAASVRMSRVPRSISIAPSMVLEQDVAALAPPTTSHYHPNVQSTPLPQVKIAPTIVRSPLTGRPTLSEDYLSIGEDRARAASPSTHYHPGASSLAFGSDVWTGQ